MIKLICLLFASECVVKAPEAYTHPCDRDWSKHSLEAKLDASIGCSTVNGKRAMLSRELEELWSLKK